MADSENAFLLANTITNTVHYQPMADSENAFLLANTITNTVHYQPMADSENAFLLALDMLTFFSRPILFFVLSS